MQEGSKEWLDNQPFESLVLYDKYRECDVHVLFSTEDATAIRSQQWRINASGYVTTRHSFLSMHAFVWKLHGNTVPKGYSIDHHFYTSPVDNRFGNLMLATQSQQNFNKDKLENATSSRHHVFKNKYGKWSAWGTSNGECTMLGSFSAEDEAACIADRWILALPEDEQKFQRLNFPEKVQEHRLLGPPPQRVYKRPLIGVRVQNGRFQARYNGKVLGMFDDLEEAAVAHDEAVIQANPKNVHLNFEEDYPEFMEHRKNRPKFSLTKTENGVGYVWIEKTQNFLCLDVDDYERCKLYRLSVQKRKTGGHRTYLVCGNKDVVLARFILGIVDATMQVIHLNKDKFDCRKVNLRAISQAEKPHHKSKREGATSQYHQVHWDRKPDTYTAEVTIPKHLRDVLGPRITKTCKTEEYVARWRDIMIKHYYPGGCHIMNFDDWTPDTELYWRQLLHISFKE